MILLLFRLRRFSARSSFISLRLTVRKGMRDSFAGVLRLLVDMSFRGTTASVVRLFLDDLVDCVFLLLGRGVSSASVCSSSEDGEDEYAAFVRVRAGRDENMVVTN